jgi:hypothetical protein
MAKSRKRDYAVGYGRPPRDTRFKKGVSGNPAGRPKGKLNLATVLAHALSALVVVSEGGRRQTKSKLEVSITQVVNKAAGGDLKATQLLLDLLPLLDPADASATLAPDLIADRELALRLAARLAGKALDKPQRDTDE